MKKALSKIFLLALLFGSNILTGQEDSRVINYPIELIYKSCLENCLEIYGMNLNRTEKFENTFISTPEFCERFYDCDPNVFEFYVRNDLKLSQVDSLTANFFYDLSTEIGDIIVIQAETDNIDTSSYYNNYLEFIEFSKEKKGFLHIIDYSKLDLESVTIKTDLKELGLRNKEIDELLEMLKNNLP